MERHPDYTVIKAASTYGKFRKHRPEGEPLTEEQLARFAVEREIALTAEQQILARIDAMLAAYRKAY